MIGTLINAAAVLVGGGLGTWLGQRLPPRIRDTVQNGLGLVTMLAGLQMALQTENILITMGSLLVGGVLGEWWRLDEGLSRIGDRLKALTQPRAKAAADKDGGGVDEGTNHLVSSAFPRISALEKGQFLFIKVPGAVALEKLVGLL